MLKQRLSCIPIHINDHSLPIDELVVEINVKNETESTIYVTTKDFKIKNTTSDKYLEESTTKKIFPPDPITNNYIIFARLSPKISKTIEGAELSITAKMSIHTAKEDGVYNVVSACAYSFTDDKLKQDEEWEKYLSNISEEKKDGESTAMIRKNWYNHDAKRYYKQNSFDFIIESIGVFSCHEIVKMSLQILDKKLSAIENECANKTLMISESISTMPYSFDIILVNENYTIGKVLEYLLHEKYYKNSNILKFVGFRHDHPHDADSKIRVSIANTHKKDTENLKIDISNLIQSICADAKILFKAIYDEF